MKEITEKQIPRRQFIRGAVSVLGFSALGLPASALAKTLESLGTPALTVGYWNGEQFISADRVTGDASLDSVSVTMHGFGSGSMKSIDVNVTVPGSPQPTIFHAWTAPPNGCAKVRFVASVGSANGLSLRVCQQSGDVECKLRASGGGSKLREGVYILAAGDLNLSSLDYANGKVMGTQAQHVVLTVARL